MMYYCFTMSTRSTVSATVLLVVHGSRATWRYLVCWSSLRTGQRQNTRGEILASSFEDVRFSFLPTVLYDRCCCISFLSNSPIVVNLYTSVENRQILSNHSIRMMSYFRRVALISLFCLASSCNGQSTSQEQRNDVNSWSPGKLRSQGEEALSMRNFEDALKFYKMAADLEPEKGSNYFQIFRVHSRDRKYGDALNAITKALELDPANDSYRVQKAKLLKSLGQCDRAVVEYTEIKNEDVGELLAEAKACESDIRAAQEALAQEDYRLASQLYSRVMRHVEQATDLLFEKCRALYHNSDYYGVISDTGKILKAHPKHLEAFELRGNAYMRLGEHDLAIQHYREALKFDPEHKGCKTGHKFVKNIEKKKKKGDEAFASRNFEEAIKKYQEAIDIDVTHRVFARSMLLKIVQAHSRLGQHDDAIKKAELLVEEGGGAVEYEWALGDALTDAERFDDALRIFQQAAENLPENSEERQKANSKIKEAQVALKQSKEKNYYKILGVSRTATKKEIKSAYRKLALEYHPDKNADNKEVAEKMFQDIGEAYEVLSDEEMKAKYDRGESVFDNQGRGGGGPHMNPHQFFHQNFGNQGFGGGGGQRFHFKMG